MEFNRPLIEHIIKNLLIQIDPDPEREGIAETPLRVAKMLNEILEGQFYTNKEIAEKYNKTFKAISDSMVIVKNIECFSLCEHHLAPMYDMYISIAYLPEGKVLGLSKFARIAELVCKRLQLQEKIMTDLFEVLSLVLNTDNIAIYITAKHACMTMRGIKKGNSNTETYLFKGMFSNNSNLQNQFLSAIKGN